MFEYLQRTGIWTTYATVGSGVGDVPSQTAPVHPIPLMSPQHIMDSIPTFFCSLAFCRTPFGSCGTNVPLDHREREISPG